jgi:hypothetical protein
MRTRTKLALTMGLTLLLAIAITGAAAAQNGDPIPACVTGENEPISGTVVAVDENGVVTIDTGGGDMCTVMLDGTWDHPIVALLGSYFDDASPEALSEALDALQIEYTCTEDPDTGDETCSVADEGGDPAEVVSVHDENGVYIVELKINGNIVMKTFTDKEQAEAWIDALDALNVDWTLKTDEEDNTFVSEVGDDIAAYHEDGWGFGQLVKAYAVVIEVQEACALDAVEDLNCDVSVGGLLESFESGGGWGQIFKEFGKPSILGVGHVRHADKEKEDKGTPPPNACGYWKNHPGDETLEDGDVDGSMTEDPCADFINKIKDKDKDKGKPPWAGGPGGKPKDEK